MEQFSKALFGPSKPKDAGHRLGGAQRRFDVTFKGASLGLTLGKDEATGRALVSKVPSTGEAASAGVKAGDAVVALCPGDMRGEGDFEGSFEELVSLVRGIGRPVRITFERGPLAAGAPAPPKPAPVMAMLQPKPKAEDVSDAERERRRAAQIKAADERSGAWNKKVASGRAARRELPAGGATAGAAAESGPSDNPETVAAVERARARESQERAHLGYDPFAVQMASSSAARAVASGSGVAEPSPAAAAAPPPAPAPGADEDVPPELQEAMGKLLQHEPADTIGAAQTISKLLANLDSKFDEPKFKTVRLANKAFDSKVGSVEGGLEIMLAAGFELAEDANGDPVLQFSDADGARAQLRCTLAQTRRLLREAGQG